MVLFLIIKIPDRKQKYGSPQTSSFISKGLASNPHSLIKFVVHRQTTPIFKTSWCP